MRFLKKSRFPYIVKGHSTRCYVSNTSIYKFYSCVGNIGSIAKDTTPLALIDFTGDLTTCNTISKS